MPFLAIDVVGRSVQTHRNPQHRIIMLFDFKISNRELKLVCFFLLGLGFIGIGLSRGQWSMYDALLLCIFALTAKRHPFLKVKLDFMILCEGHILIT
jgi:hypothetical protein